MRWLIIMLLCIPLVYGSSLDADIFISKNDIVREDITLYVEGVYDTVEFTTQYMPVTVEYGGEYFIRTDAEGYVLEFPFEEELKFSLYYDDLVDRSFRDRVFRSSFYPQDTDEISLRLTLPAHFVLSEKEPNAIPRPDSITTDGQRMTLSWKLTEGTDISVFYENQGMSLWWLLVFLIVILVSAGLVIFYKKKSDDRVHDILSSEEKKVMEQIARGGSKQNNIAKELGFSKSKMSKVVRKLEEKNMIKKEPYFKTNKLIKK